MGLSGTSEPVVTAGAPLPITLAGKANGPCPAADLSFRAKEYPRSRYAWYVAIILLLANLCCYIARITLFLLVQPIRQDLQISDTQMSLLQGAAFSIFFVIAGLPAGWLTDRRGRRNILIASILTWSVMAVLCGMAASYGELFLARAGLGIGEAALTPAALSLIADYFPPERRGRAMALYYIGTPVGSGIATLVGGFALHWFNGGGHLPWGEQLLPWQAVFVLSGAPGFVVALLLLSVREPARHEVAVLRNQEQPLTNRFGVLSYMRRRWAVFVPVFISFSIVQYCAYASASWAIPLLVRRDGVTTPEAGSLYGLVIASTGVLAAAFGGVIGDRLGQTRRNGGRFRAVIYAYAIFIPGVLLMCLAHDVVAATAGMALQFLGVCISASVMYTVIQDIVPNQYRGQAIALLSLLVTLGSATLAPTIVALITDRLFHDPNMVGFSILLATLPAAAIGLVLTFAGLKPFSIARADMIRELAEENA